MSNPGRTGPPHPLNWQGAWSAAGAYAADDIVTYGGNTFHANAPSGPTATPPSGPGPATPTLLGANRVTAAAGGSGSSNINVPNNVLPGDVILVAMAGWYGGGAGSGQPPTPTGYTLVQFQNIGGFNPGLTIWRKTAIAADAGATVVVANSNFNGQSVHLRAYRTQGYDVSAINGTATPPNVNTIANLELLADFYAVRDTTPTTFTPPGGGANPLSSLDGPSGIGLDSQDFAAAAAGNNQPSGAAVSNGSSPLYASSAVALLPQLLPTNWDSV